MLVQSIPKQTLQFLAITCFNPQSPYPQPYLHGCHLYDNIPQVFNLSPVKVILNILFFRTNVLVHFLPPPSFKAFLLTFPKPLSSVQLLDCKLDMVRFRQVLISKAEIS